MARRGENKIPELSGSEFEIPLKAKRNRRDQYRRSYEQGACEAKNRHPMRLPGLVLFICTWVEAQVPGLRVH